MATAAQMRALKKARKALVAKYGTSNIGKIAKMKGRRGKGRRRALSENKSAPSRAVLAENKSAPAPLAENRGRGRYEGNEENDMDLEENKRRRRGKRRKKSRGKRRGLRITAAGTVGGRRGKRRRKGAKRRRQKARRTARKASRRRSTVTKTHIVRLPPAKAAQVQVVEVRRKGRKGRKRSAPKRRKGRRRKKAAMMLAENPGLFSGNSGMPVLYENQAGPFAGTTLRNYGVLVGALTFGLIVADVTDRAVSTRGLKDGKNPLYGKDAAAGYRRRPDAWRLAAQGGGGVAGLFLAYMARGRGILPFAISGVSLGFGVNFVKMLWDWFAAPAILKVKPEDAGKATWANRLYPMEQDWIQVRVAEMFDKWQATTLAPGQQTPPQIASPAPPTPAGPVYTLGGAQAQQIGNGQSARTFQPLGRLGRCQQCGGHNGCFSDCPTMCSSCPEYNQGVQCKYQVLPGDNLEALAAQGGVTVAQVAMMNAGQDPNVFWQPGNMVVLPYGMCQVVQALPGSAPTVSPVLPEGTPFIPAPLVEETVIIPPGEMVAPAGPFAPGPTYAVSGATAGISEQARRSLELAGAFRRD